MCVTCQVLSHFQLPKANSLLQTEQQNVCHSFFTILKSRTLWKSHKNLVLSWLTDNMLEFIGNRHLLPSFGIFRIKSWICQSGATIVVQILSSASASKAPTAYFPLIKTLNNNYNLCSVSLSAVPKNWSHWEKKESFSVFLEFLVSHFEQLNGLSLQYLSCLIGALKELWLQDDFFKKEDIRHF